jgi:hypothetical protein
LDINAAFSDNTTIDQDDGHAPVVERVEVVIGVDVPELRLDAERTEGG